MTDSPAPGVRTRLGLLAGLLLALAGCAETGVPAGGATLTDIYWVLVEVDGDTFSNYQGTREPNIVFRREGGRVTGFSGCNNMAGGYETSGDALRVGPLALTRMACLGADATAMESAFVRALDQTTAYRINGAVLELRDAAGTTRVRLEAHGPAR